jgi:RNA ligase (TIGR02306 family)
MTDNIETPEVQEVEKNLAVIRKIEAIKPHPNADKMELAKVLEWWVCVPKGVFKEGDLCVYIAIDTVVPSDYIANDKNPFAFLESKHYRIKTIRLRGELSQGIIFKQEELGYGNGMEGADLTELVRVKKYEKPIPANLHGTVKGNFPTKYVSITDEERLQNCSRIIEELNGVPTYVSVKMDGTSATYIYNKPEELSEGEVHVCSRKLSLKPPAESDTPNVYWTMEKKYNLLDKIKSKGNYAVQGEICGPGIQGNKMGLKEVDLYVFNVFNILERRYLNFDEFIAFTNELGLKTVPIIDTNFSLKGKTFQEMLKMAEGNYDNGTPREGIVIRPLFECYSDYMKGRVSFKIVNNKFLEKYQE